MDRRQRGEVAEQVRVARESKGWSQARLATEADLGSANTVGAIEAGRSVRPGSLGKVYEALGIEPMIEAQRREEIPADVHLVVETIGLWLSEMPEEDRPRAVLDLVRYVSQPQDTDE